MNARWMMIGALTIGFSLGCMGGEVVTEDPVPQPADLTPEQKAGAVAKAVDADAAKAGDALKEQGMDEAGFEALMYDIAGDSERTKSYMDARK